MSLGVHVLQEAETAGVKRLIGASQNPVPWSIAFPASLPNLVSSSGMTACTGLTVAPTPVPTESLQVPPPWWSG